jgi:Lon protease-like protein
MIRKRLARGRRSARAAARTLRTARMGLLSRMDFPAEVPVMTLRNATLLPGSLLPLYIFEPRYRRMLKDVLETHRMFSVAMQDPGSAIERPVRVAGVGIVRASTENADGTSHLILQGLRRVRFVEPVKLTPYRIERIELPAPATPPGVAAEALAGRLLEIVEKRFLKTGEASKAEQDCTEPCPGDAERSLVRQLEDVQDPGLVADIIAGTFLDTAAQRQAILEDVEPEQRLRRLFRIFDDADDRITEN